MEANNRPCRVIMPCGAMYESAKIFTRHNGFNIDDKTGRFRLVVIDTHSGTVGPPKNADGTCALCVSQCPCPDKAGRNVERCISERELSPDRMIVTCHIERQFKVHG